MTGSTAGAPRSRPPGIGLIQAYIFAVLAMVYIASAARSHAGEEEDNDA